MERKNVMSQEREVRLKVIQLRNFSRGNMHNTLYKLTIKNKKKFVTSKPCIRRYLLWLGQCKGRCTNFVVKIKQENKRANKRTNQSFGLPSILVVWDDRWQPRYPRAVPGLLEPEPFSHHVVRPRIEKQLC